MEATATQIAGVLGEAQGTRQQWDALTEPSRRAAIAADAELRRRHPEQVLESLSPAGHDEATPPGAAVQSGTEVLVQPTLEESVSLPSTAAPEQASYQAGHSPVPDPASPATPLEIAGDGIPPRIMRIRENARAAQAEIDRLSSARIPDGDTDEADLGLSWSALTRRDRAAVIQPPRPEIIPASEILRQAGAGHADVVPETGHA
ncbi:MAG: hypothetical protein ACR2MP_13795 [Streptosporangiaceae bacterium]